MIVPLYDYSLSDTYKFVFFSQSIIVTLSTKANAINEKACSSYTCGFVLVTKIIIARVLVLFRFMKSSYSCRSKSLLTHHM